METFGLTPLEYIKFYNVYKKARYTESGLFDSFYARYDKELKNKVRMKKLCLIDKYLIHKEKCFMVHIREYNEENNSFIGSSLTFYNDSKIMIRKYMDNISVNGIKFNIREIPAKYFLFNENNSSVELREYDYIEKELFMEIRTEALNALAKETETEFDLNGI